MRRCNARLALAVVFVLCSSAALAAGEPYRLDHRIALPGDSGWDYSIVDAPAHRLYLSRGNRVDVLDTRAEKIVGSIRDTYGVHGIALAPDLGKGFTSNGLSGTVRVFDLRTLKPGRLIPAGANPDCIVYDPFTRRVFVFNGKSRNATVIDARKESVLATIPLDCKPEFAVTDARGTVFFNREDKNGVGALDAVNLRVKAAWPLKASSPSGLALDLKGHRLFSVCADGKMEVLDSSGGGILAEVPIGAHPDAAAFDAGTGLAFSSNGEGTLTVIDASHALNGSLAVLQTLPTQKGARTMALDPSTHTLYLVCARYLQTPASAGKPHVRPKIAPGSVALLVLKPR